VPTEVAPIRVLDAAVWRLHRDGHTRKSCPGLSF
jgi:hypothetical protein